MARKTTLEKNTEVVRSLRKDRKMSFDDIKAQHSHLSAAVEAVREEEASGKKEHKSTGSGCCVSQPSGTVFV